MTIENRAERDFRSPPRRAGSTGRRSKTSLDRYLAEIRRYPLLTRERETDLAREAQRGCRESLDRLVESNLRFVVVVARRYRDCGVPLEDLINEGNLGLMEAARRFDHSRGVRFVSWAVWWIRKSIRKAAQEQLRMVRVPLPQPQRTPETRVAEMAQKEDLRREPTAEETWATLPTESGRERAFPPVSIRLSSLDAPLDAGHDRTLADLLVDLTRCSAESEMLDRESRDRVRALKERLDDRQKIVISHRFGLDGEPPLTLAETGERIGVSRERARQIEITAIRRLRRGFLARGNTRVRGVGVRSAPRAS